MREIEHAALRERTAKHRGSRAALAAELGISERSLYRKLKAAGAA
ncbi:MAG: helix-turn-helix domain-containing protein [Burkholderiaceae bacterium]